MLALKLIILFFLLVIFSSESQAQPIVQIINAHKNPGNGAEIELAIRIVESAIFQNINDFGISPLKTYNDNSFDNILIRLLISGKMFIQ